MKKNEYLKSIPVDTLSDLVRVVSHNAKASAKSVKKLDRLTKRFERVRKATGWALICYGIGGLLELLIDASQLRRIEDLEARIELLESDLEDYKKE